MKTLTGSTSRTASEEPTCSWSRPAISVGISTCDRPEALARALDAILDGQRRPEEVVVVDQGRSPATAVIDDRRHRGIPLLHVTQSRRGLAASRNAILRHTTGDIVAITDDDCVPMGAWLSVIAAAFQRQPSPAAVTGRVLPLGPDEPGTFASSSRTSIDHRDFTSCRKPWVLGTGANFAATRALLLELGGFDERLGAGSPGMAAEDLDMSARIVRAGGRIRYDPGAVVLHQRHSRDQRVASRWTYGHGIGALCAMTCRGHGAEGLLTLGYWLRSVAGRLWCALRQRDARSIHESLLLLGGTGRGWFYGCHVPNQQPTALPYPARTT
jgi:GT2 family glycosyltransferase